MTNPGRVYVLIHTAWDKLSMVKVGRTGRDPRTCAAEITSVSGLLAPATVAWCSPVSDMVAAEQAAHRMLGSRRVRKRRELFRVDATTARGVVEAVAGFLPASGPPPTPSPHFVSARPVLPWRPRPRPSRPGTGHHGWRHVPVPVRVAVGVAALVSWFTLVQPHLGRGWLF